MSTLSQKRCNYKVEDDDTSSSSEYNRGILARSAQGVILSDVEVIERIPQRVNPIVAQVSYR